ncbi:Putative methyltransferase NSUN6 [Auxenochlorella protothecoides]|uniref:Putative methyltransferase NSUN6 n=1 Tax=Auxenochlorella protothecoides TaxID=3075 RepID=A0A087SAE1_AUXPR|nr:Putative methyltransferase NSUN6 [Auxenochlorella protothecoides]KFM22695.1 Putative methyltransferase NSUN6 [Auxenochlorella protothecoides]
MSASHLDADVTIDAEGVRHLLSEGLGPARFQAATRRLRVPPLTTCLRVNSARASPADLLRLLRGAAEAQGTPEAALPRLHPLIPEAILIPGSGPHSVDYSAAEGREVVIVRKAGEAVLRGADVFVPGVLATTPGLCPGDVVVVSIALERPGSERYGISRGYRLGSDPGLEAGVPPRVRVGLGRCLLSRADMFRHERGVGVALVARVAHIRRLAREAGVEALVTAYRADACRCVRGLAAGSTGAGERGATCAEGAGPAAERGPSSGPPQGDVAGARHPHESQLAAPISEGLRRRLERQALARQRHGQQLILSAHTAEGREAECPGFDPGSFDHVLCDVPCSALGLRPRFRHEQTVEELVGTAQYQRRILAAGVGALRPGGTMVFSTCTISHLENEANVRWLLDSFPLRLVPALPRLGGPGLVAPQAQPPLLTAAEAAMVQRFDPGEPASDTIGFFIAKFVKL